MRQSLPQPRRSFQGRSPLLRGARSRQLGVGIPSAPGEEVFGREAKAEQGGRPRGERGRRGSETFKSAAFSF